MAIALSETKVIPISQSEALVYGTVTFSGSYPTGGEDITGQVPGSTEYETFQGNAAGWLLTHDRANNKVQAWGSNGAAPAALAEHAAAAFAVAGTYIAVRPT
jgi:hypothetical protein